jgi:hypothetical protein
VQIEQRLVRPVGHKQLGLVQPRRPARVARGDPRLRAFQGKSRQPLPVGLQSPMLTAITRGDHDPAMADGPASVGIGEADPRQRHTRGHLRCLAPVAADVIGQDHHAAFADGHHPLLDDGTGQQRHALGLAHRQRRAPQCGKAPFILEAGTGCGKAANAASDAAPASQARRCGARTVGGEANVVGCDRPGGNGQPAAGVSERPPAESGERWRHRRGDRSVLHRVLVRRRSRSTGRKQLVVPRAG